jgi:hypothetical protein
MISAIANAYSNKIHIIPFISLIKIIINILSKPQRLKFQLIIPFNRPFLFLFTPPESGNLRDFLPFASRNPSHILHKHPVKALLTLDHNELPSHTSSIILFG